LAGGGKIFVKEGKTMEAGRGKKSLCPNRGEKVLGGARNERGELAVVKYPPHRGGAAAGRGEIH